MKKIFLLITLSMITSILHAAEQEPRESWDSTHQNSTLAIAPYLLTYHADEFDSHVTSTLMTGTSDNYLMSTTSHNNDMDTADDEFASEQKQSDVPHIDQSLAPQLSHDNYDPKTLSSTIAKVVEKLQDKHQTAVKRGMKNKKTYVCIPCNFGPAIKEKFEDHVGTKKHCDNIGIPMTYTYQCDSCNYRTNSDGDFKRHKTSDTHLINTGTMPKSTTLQDPTYTCPSCRYTTDSWHGIREHTTKTGHSLNVPTKKDETWQQNKFKCTECKIGTKTQAQLDLHELSDSHRDVMGLPRLEWHEKKYVCEIEICQFGAHKENELKTHRKTKKHKANMLLSEKQL